MRTLEDLNLQEKKDLVEQVNLKKNGELDMDWSELCDRFHLSINPETLRKAGVGIKLASDACMIANNSVDDGGYIERQKMRDLQRQVNSSYRSESRSELLRETVSEAIKQLKDLPRYDQETGASSCWRSANKSLVVTLGDFHYGASIHVTGLHGEVLNHYDHHVFESRMKSLLSELIYIIRKEDVSVVDVFLVGDLVDGMLRQSQLMRLEYGLVESTIKVSEFLAEWLNDLSKYVSKVRVHSVTGNHSEVRPLQSKHRDFEDENLEKVIAWYLKERLSKTDRVIVDAKSDRMSFVDVCGFHFLLLHGDGDKRIEQIARDTVNLYGEKIDYFVCGHLHKEEEYLSGSTNSGNSFVIRTPSLCGMDSYAQKKGYGGHAGAIAMVIEEGYGRRCVYPLKLS